MLAPLARAVVASLLILLGSAAHAEAGLEPAVEGIVTALRGPDFEMRALDGKSTATWQITSDTRPIEAAALGIRVGDRLFVGRPPGVLGNFVFTIERAMPDPIHRLNVFRHQYPQNRGLAQRRGCWLSPRYANGAMYEICLDGERGALILYRQDAVACAARLIHNERRPPDTNPNAPLWLGSQDARCQNRSAWRLERVVCEARTSPACTVVVAGQPDWRFELAPR